jgi:hypothetical protein
MKSIMAISTLRKGAPFGNQNAGLAEQKLIIEDRGWK